MNLRHESAQIATDQRLAAVRRLKAYRDTSMSPCGSKSLRWRDMRARSRLFTNRSGSSRNAVAAPREGRRPRQQRTAGTLSLPPGIDGHGSAEAARAVTGTGLYSTWMFFAAQMSFRTCGHTETSTSPIWAVRSRYMNVRDWPIPPPMLSGISSFRIAWW